MHNARKYFLKAKDKNLCAFGDICWQSQRCGGSSVVRAPDSWSKGRGSNPCWSCRRIFFSRVNFLCWLLFRYPFHPRVTAVARKRPRSFCQKHRWQVTAKHAYTLHMWLCMKWHGAWLYGVHRTRRNWLSGSRFLWHQPSMHKIKSHY